MILKNESDLRVSPPKALSARQTQESSIRCVVDSQWTATLNIEEPPRFQFSWPRSEDICRWHTTHPDQSVRTCNPHCPLVLDHCLLRSTVYTLGQ